VTVPHLSFCFLAKPQVREPFKGNGSRWDVARNVSAVGVFSGMPKTMDRAILS